MTAVAWIVAIVAAVILAAILIAIALADGNQRVQRALAQAEAERRRYADRSVREVEQMRSVRTALSDDAGSVGSHVATALAAGALVLLGFLLCIGAL